MVAKYQCPKCEKRFVDWGAEKLGFKCPQCLDETLLRIGAKAAAAAPKLKRRPAKVTPVEDEEALIAPDVELEEEDVADDGDDAEFSASLPDDDETEEVVIGKPKKIAAPTDDDATEDAADTGDEESDEVIPVDLVFEEDATPEPSEDIEEEL